MRLNITSLWLRSLPALVACTLLLGGCSGGDAPPGGDFTPIQGEAEVGETVSLDIQSHANLRRSELLGLPRGKHVLGGVKFHFGDKLLQLSSKSKTQFPPQITGIPVERTFRTLYLMHSTQGGAYQKTTHPMHEKDGTTIGRYEVHYQDGGKETIPIVYGQDLRGWWDWDKSKPTSRAKIAWRGNNPRARRYNVDVRLYLFRWQNPHPEKTVASIDFISTNAKAAPFCAAISLGGASSPAIAQSDDPVTPDPGGNTASKSGGDPQQTGKKPNVDPQTRDRWLAQVDKVIQDQRNAVRPLIDKMDVALSRAIDHASDERARKRLAQDQSTFSKDRMWFSRSPEVIQQSQAYFQQRYELEKQFLRKLNHLQSTMPAGIDPAKRQSFQKGMTLSKQAVQRLDGWENLLAQAAKPKPPSGATPNTGTSKKPPATTSKPPSTTPGKKFLSSAPKDWAVRVDPPPAAVKFPQELPYQVLEGVNPSKVLYAPGQTAFLAAGSGKNVDVESFQLYDLRTGKVAGKASGFRVDVGPLHDDGPAMSPDGSYLAIYESSAVFVGDMKQQQAVAKLSPFRLNETKVFLSSRRLLTYHFHREPTARVWEIPSGKLLTSIPIVDSTSTNHVTACSPGGRYFATVGDDDDSTEVVYIYDLETGKQAGVLKIPILDKSDPRFHGIAFSPDGSEFAAYVFGMKNGAFSIGHAMFCWDIETGRLTYREFLESLVGQDLIVNSTEHLQWFPDGQGWLVKQRYVIDRDGAVSVQRVKSKGEYNTANCVKVLDNNRILVGDGNNQVRVIKVKRKR